MPSSNYKFTSKKRVELFLSASGALSTRSNLLLKIGDLNSISPIKVLTYYNHKLLLRAPPTRLEASNNTWARLIRALSRFKGKQCISEVRASSCYFYKHCRYLIHMVVLHKPLNLFVVLIICYFVNVSVFVCSAISFKPRLGK